MGVIVKPKTWADNENVTYTNLNGNFDTIYTEFNGNIENANIKTGAAIDPAKISGTAATLNGSETLTNKTITAPNITTIKVTTAYSKGNLGSSPTINWSQGDLQTGTLTANCTFAFSNATAGQRLTFFALENGTGTYTISFTPTIIWQDNVTPTWTTTANKMNAFVIYYDGSNYYGMGAKFA